MDKLQELKKLDKDIAFLDSLARVKQENKMRVAKFIADEYQVQVNPASIFDIHVWIILFYITALICELK